MVHPLLHLIATQPHLLGEHVEAYAQLVGEEVGKASTMWISRVVYWAAALALIVLAVLFAGIALMLWAGSPVRRQPRGAVAADRRAAGAVRRRRDLHTAGACQGHAPPVRHDPSAVQRRRGDAARRGRRMNTTGRPRRDAAAADRGLAACAPSPARVAPMTAVPPFVTESALDEGAFPPAEASGRAAERARSGDRVARAAAAGDATPGAIGREAARPRGQRLLLAAGRAPARDAGARGADRGGRELVVATPAAHRRRRRCRGLAHAGCAAGAAQSAAVARRRRLGRRAARADPPVALAAEAGAAGRAAAAGAVARNPAPAGRIVAVDGRGAERRRPGANPGPGHDRRSAERSDARPRAPHRSSHRDRR